MQLLKQFLPCARGRFLTSQVEAHGVAGRLAGSARIWLWAAAVLHFCSLSAGRSLWPVASWLYKFHVSHPYNTMQQENRLSVFLLCF